MASIEYPASNTPLNAGGPKIYGPDAADNATVAQMKASAPEGSNVYVFSESQTVVIPTGNGSTGILEIIAGWPIVLSAADQAKLTGLGITLPEPS